MEKKNLQVFGYGLAVIITFFSVRHVMKHGFSNGPYIAFAVAAIFALTTAVSLNALRPVYRIWMKGARFIGEIVSFVLLAAIFYVIFGLVGIVLRLMRKDLLDERINKSAKTYWLSARSGVYDRERYTKQF